MSVERLYYGWISFTLRHFSEGFTVGVNWFNGVLMKVMRVEESTGEI